MKIIDFAHKGNVVRLYLGADELEEWYGDDWDDHPYEHNAGPVYSRFISGWVDIGCPYDWYVMEPANDWRFGGNSPYCKDDFVHRDAPCILIVPKDELEGGPWGDSDDYGYWVASDRSFKIYFGDDEAKIRRWKYYDEVMAVWTA